MRRYLLFATLAVISTFAHELEDNRATLVLRDQTHISVTFYIAYGDALQMALAPRRNPVDFIAAVSSMNLESLEKQLTKAEETFRKGAHLYTASGREIPLGNWVFPGARVVQQNLQKRVMQAMVDPAGHAHDEPLEIHADGYSPEAVTAVRIQLPEEFGKVLVVAYRPSQVWVEPKSWSPAIKF